MALIEVYLSSNDPQKIKDEYFWASKILNAEYKPASLDYIIKTCENLHVEEQHQYKILIKKYEHLFHGTLGEFNMEKLSLQLMDANRKPNHALVYSVHFLDKGKKNLQQRKGIIRLVDFGILEEDYSSEWAFLSFAITKKT
jgi:hypothetical protein